MDEKTVRQFVKNGIENNVFTNEIAVLKAMLELVTEKDIGIKWTENELKEIRNAFSCAIGSLYYSSVMIKKYNDDLK